MRKRTIVKQLLATALAFVLAFSSGGALGTVFAATEIDWTKADEEGTVVVEPETVCGDVVIPSGKSLLLPGEDPDNGVPAGSLKADSITIRSDGALLLFGGNLECSNIIPEQGARIMVGFDAKNILAGLITVYDPEGINQVEPRDWAEYIYLETDEENNPINKWVEMVEENMMSVAFDGLTEGIHPSISYSVDNGANWIDVDMSNLQEWGGIDFEIVFPEGFVFVEGEPIPVTVRINVNDENDAKRQIVYASIGEMEIMESVTGEGRTLEYTFTDIFNPDIPHDIHIALEFPDAGDGAIVNKANEYLYAFSADSVDGIKADLAHEFYDRFFRVDTFGSFGVGTGDSPEDWANGIARLKDKISLTENGTYTVNTKTGTATYNKYRAVVNWGAQEAVGTPVVSELNVYQIKEEDAFLACTDFANGNGSKFYVRKRVVDETDLYNRDGGEHYTIVVNDFGHVAVGKNGGKTTVKNDIGLYSVDLVGEGFGYNIRFLKEDETYVAIVGEGETLKTDGLGLHGASKDTVWKTGTGMTAQEFIGYSSVTIVPINNVGVDTYTVKSVSLKNASMKDAVKITKVAEGQYKVSFESNFYDSVPLTVEYSDGTTEDITIERVGLVISYRFLSGDLGKDEELTDKVWFDCKSGSFDFNYNYYKGEQVLVYATYYHPSNNKTAASGDKVYLNVAYGDGTREIISDSKRRYYVPADAEGVATTTFILGYAPSHGWDNMGKIWTGPLTEIDFKHGSVNATVINEGFDGADSYGGTQCGSGKGVYWDGHISWFSNN